MQTRLDVGKAGAAYLAPVFALGWVLGPIREVVLGPRIGRVAAAAVEAALMAAATHASARAAVRRLGDDVPFLTRLEVGAAACAMLVPLELAGARLLRGRSPRAYLATFRTPEGAVSAAAFAWFALAPALAGAAGRSVCVTHAERARALPGDELIAATTESPMHAITIRAPRSAVWPWLAQMGAGRAGWYSYDAFDNGGRPSAKRIIAELQQLQTGMLFPWLPGATEGFTLLRAEHERHLVLGWVPPGGGPPKMTWAFVLEDADDGRATRLLVRARAGGGYAAMGMPPLPARLVLPAVHAIMQRKQLLTIAARAERCAAISAAADDRRSSGPSPSECPVR